MRSRMVHVELFLWGVNEPLEVDRERRELENMLTCLMHFMRITVTLKATREFHQVSKVLIGLR